MSRAAWHYGQNASWTLRHDWGPQTRCSHKGQLVSPEGVHVAFHQTLANHLFLPAPVVEPFQLFTAEMMKAQRPDIIDTDCTRYDLAEILGALELDLSAAFEFTHSKSEAALINGRPPSRASAASYGSCDSCVSHPQVKSAEGRGSPTCPSQTFGSGSWERMIIFDTWNRSRPALQYNKPCTATVGRRSFGTLASASTSLQASR